MVDHYTLIYTMICHNLNTYENPKSAIFCAHIKG